jgi:hypothetical protein
MKKIEIEPFDNENGFLEKSGYYLGTQFINDRNGGYLESIIFYYDNENHCVEFIGDETKYDNLEAILNSISIAGRICL